MQLLDDIDSFEPRAIKIFSLGLTPICDHKGLDEGKFCCTECSNPLFDKDDLILEKRAFYRFRRPIGFSLLEFRFDSSYIYPKICIDCSFCQQPVGYLDTFSHRSEKIFHVFAKTVYLQIPTDLSPHSEHLQ